MKAAGIFVIGVIELAAGVKLREYDLDAGDAEFRMDTHGNAAAVVFDGRAAVGKKCDLDVIGVAVRRFVDGVVDDLPQKMMKPARIRRADIHARAAAHRLQAL